MTRTRPYSKPMVSRYEYGHDAVGRRKWMTYTGGQYVPGIADFWSYNDRGELISSDRYGGDPQVLDPPRSHDFAYDPIGNRLESTAGLAATVHYCTNELNQYVVRKPSRSTCRAAVSRSTNWNPAASMAGWRCPAGRYPCR